MLVPQSVDNPLYLIGENFVSFGTDVVVIGGALLGPVQAFAGQGQKVRREVRQLGSSVPSLHNNFLKVFELQKLRLSVITDIS